MDTPGFGIDRLLEGVCIRALQLGELPPFQHLVGDFRSIRGQALKYALIRGVLPALTLLATFVAQLVEQHFA